MLRSFLKLPMMALLALFAEAQVLQHETGLVDTEEVELGFETFEKPSEAIPVVAVNGGLGLSHVYMLQNDMWQKVARHRLVIF